MYNRSMSRRNIKKLPSLIISCQIPAGEVGYDNSLYMKSIIDSVASSEVQAVRISGVDAIKYTKEKHKNLLVFGLKKVINEKSPLTGFVTPDFESAKEIIDAGADVIIVESSNLLHDDTSLKDFLYKIKEYKDIKIGCDIGTLEEANRAVSFGADYLLTTFVQAKTRENKTFIEHLELIESLSSLEIPIIAEGGIDTPDQANQLFVAGAGSVVVGRAIVSPRYAGNYFLKDITTSPHDLIENFLRKHTPNQLLKIENIAPHGSSRRYFKLIFEDTIMLATMSFNVLENIAFIELSKHLKSKGVNVPHVHICNKEKTLYIQDYKGERDLYSFMVEKTEPLEEKERLLGKAIELLVSFQEKGSDGWDYQKSYPFASFDEEEIDRDTKRFIDKFLSLSNVEFNSIELQKEVTFLKELIKEVPKEDYCLMHRDFQSRNIILDNEGEMSLIDFQGSRFGPIHYDLASLLFQSQVDYSIETIDKMIGIYIDLKKYKDKDLFIKRFYVVSMVRMIQTIGSYGIGALEQKKDYFIKSIPYALDRFSFIISKVADLGYDFPEMYRIINNANIIYDSAK